MNNMKENKNFVCWLAIVAIIAIMGIVIMVDYNHDFIENKELFNQADAGYISSISEKSDLVGEANAVKTRPTILSAYQEGCSESDGGINLEEKGVTKKWIVYRNGNKKLDSKSDFCKDDKVVVEYYCNKNGIQSTETYCPDERICKDGTCLPKGIECISNIHCDDSEKCMNNICVSVCDLDKFYECIANNYENGKYNCTKYCFTEPFEDETKLEKGEYIVIVPGGYEELGNYKLEWMANCYEDIGNYLGIKANLFSKNIVNRFKYLKGQYYSVAFIKGVASYYDEETINNYMANMIAGGMQKNINSCSGDILKHELTHIYLMNTPIPKWLDEGLATYIPYKDTDSIKCEEEGYIYDDSYYKYENLSNTIGVPFEDYHRYYQTGYCFWDYIEKTYGHDKFQQILSKLAEYRDTIGVSKDGEALFELCYDPTFYFIEKIIIPVLSIDISDVTEIKFGFGHGFVGC